MFTFSISAIGLPIFEPNFRFAKFYIILPRFKVVNVESFFIRFKKLLISLLLKLLAKIVNEVRNSKLIPPQTASASLGLIDFWQ